MANISLLNSTSRIEVPFVKVTFGTYTFGVYQKIKSKEKDLDGFYQAAKITYPNYVKSLSVTKINGQVNQYTLTIVYPITENDDPNFFEKVFSSVNKTRKMVLSYGDISLPTYIYKDEQAIITGIKSSFDTVNSRITYIVSAVSSAALLKSGTYTFIGGEKKPSTEIKKLLYNKNYGLQEIFYGMNNRGIVELKGLIDGNDKVVKIETKTNISALDYLLYLVSCMTTSGGDMYSLVISDDTTGEFGGPYFKIFKVSKILDKSSAYEIDIGYPTANIVTGFTVDNDENYSIFYDWQKELNNQEYTYRLNNSGEWEEVYAPIVSSRNNTYTTRVVDKNWWNRVTEYPISATVTIKGLLRPTILMTYVRLNIWFFGNKHINSGLYIVTKQVDNIDEGGYRTTLSLTRISGDSV